MGKTVVVAMFASGVAMLVFAGVNPLGFPCLYGGQLSKWV